MTAKPEFRVVAGGAADVFDAAAFDAIVAIYRASIEPSEQKAPEVLAAAARDRRYRFVAASIEGRIAAFAICFRPQGARFWLLEYMATDATRRSAGLGAALFAWCRAHYAQEGATIALLEVDDARGGAPATASDRARRLAFYARQGCRVVEGLGYILPLATNGAPPPMLLLAHAPAALHAVARCDIRDWLTRLYVEVYDMPPDDPRLARMIAPLPERVPLVAIGV